MVCSNYTDFDNFWCIQQQDLQLLTGYKHTYITVFFAYLISQLFYGIRIMSLPTSPQFL